MDTSRLARVAALFAMTAALAIDASAQKKPSPPPPPPPPPAPPSLIVYAANGLAAARFSGSQKPAEYPGIPEVYTAAISVGTAVTLVPLGKKSTTDPTESRTLDWNVTAGEHYVYYGSTDCTGIPLLLEVDPATTVQNRISFQLGMNPSIVDMGLDGQKVVYIGQLNVPKIIEVSRSRRIWGYDNKIRELCTQISATSLEAVPLLTTFNLSSNFPSPLQIK